MEDLTTITREVVSPGGVHIVINNLIKEFPNGVTLTGFFRRADLSGGYANCFYFEEGAGRYFFANSGDLKILSDKYLEFCGSAEKVDALLKQHKIRLKVEKVPTKSHKTYVKCTYLETVDAEEG